MTKGYGAPGVSGPLGGEPTPTVPRQWLFVEGEMQNSGATCPDGRTDVACGP